ncbi:MAG TPA: hypothetical protein VN825_01580, partial [Candidatus Acidoferrum sp.]|nr:hypothetical protein [Candidatus Acidoferrum sp.]
MYLQANIAGMRKSRQTGCGATGVSPVGGRGRPPLHLNVALARSAKKLREFLRRVDQDIRRS